MDNIEEKFYKTFGIEKKCNRETLKFCVGNLDCNTCKSPFYPKITDRILLELICALADTFVGEYCVPDVDYNNLKWHILQDCINNNEKGQLNDLVQSLFKEGK